MLNDLDKHYNEVITVQGFVDKVRSLADIQFLIIRAGEDKLQITLEKNDQNAALNQIVNDLTLDSTVKVTGQLLANASVKMGGRELIPTAIIVTSKAAMNKPFDYKDRSNALRETRLDYRFLDLRRSDNQLFFKIQTFIEYKMMEYWVTNGYYMLHTPKISKGGAEGGATLFSIDYFGTKAYLSQSPQLYKQMAMASGFEKFCEISQVYRAENSHTSYHQTEIEMIDMEMSWVSDVNEVMDEQERFIKFFLKETIAQFGEVMQKEFKSIPTDLTIPFPRISFNDAKTLLKEQYHYLSTPDDMDRHDEELLGKYAKEKYHTDFVFVYNYPAKTRAFYTKHNDDGYSSASYDLIYKGLEITSGAIRENDYDRLINNIEGSGIDPKTLSFYTEFFKYGCPPHGGLGMGMARFMMLLFNYDNIREATFLYRGPTRLEP